MKSRILLLLLLAGLGMTGCGKLPKSLSQANAAIKPQPMTDEQKFALLDHEAKARNLRYNIFCTAAFHGGVEQYQADAEHIEANPRATYIDEGRMDEWMETGPTQADAAYALYLSIQGQPTHLAQDQFVRPAWQATVATKCKRDIKGNWKYSPAKDAK